MRDNNFITPKEVKEKLNYKDNSFILVDIREQDEYKDWNIKGSVNIPVNLYIVKGNTEEIKKSFSSLPKDKEIITVCARGINSQVASAILREMNYNSIYLQKGMKGWNENYDIYKIDIDDENAGLAQFVRIGKGCLSYMLCCIPTRETAIFDSSIFIDEYLDFVKHNNLKVKYIIDTHSHADHFSGAMALSKALGVSYYINKIDIDNGFSYKSLEGIKSLELGNLKIDILETPGHTDGSLSFLIDGNALICGDFLLIESVGRPDLARSQEETINGAKKLYNTVQNVLFKLDDEVKILPAHFTVTELRPVSLTLGELKQQNKSLSISNKDEFVKYITESMPQTPPNYQSIKKFNETGTIIPLDYAEELEIGPNRCAVRN